MGKAGRMGRVKKACAIGMMGTAFQFPFGGCDLGEFTTTSTTTLDGREVVSFLVRSAILTPIEGLIDAGIEYLFDRLDGEDEMV